MKTIIYNDKMLDTVFSEMYRMFNEYKELSVEFGKPYKDHSLRQLGFFWGAIVDSVIDFYHQQGIKYSPDEVKTNFYQAIAPRKTITQFNGKQYETWKSISEMSLEEMSEFIDKSIWLCDNARAFQGLILHPSIRYTFIRHIGQNELRSIDTGKFPRKCPEYLEHIRKQACICCGRFGCEAHHLKETGKSGVAYKVDDWETVPLCNSCHREYHIKGKQEFMENLKWITKYLSLEDFCVVNFNRWFVKGK